MALVFLNPLPIVVTNKMSQDAFFPPNHTEELHHMYILHHWVALLDALRDKGEEGKIKTQLEHIMKDYMDVYKYTTPLYSYLRRMSKL